MTDVERVDRSDMLLSRREIMGGSAVVAGAAVAGVMPSEAMAQQGPTMEISGTVTDQNGAVEGATVDAVPHDSSLDVLRTTTDANGDYIFDNGDLHGGENLYHVIARDGTEADPRRGQQNYPFIAATGEVEIPDSVVNRWPFDEGSGTTATDTEGNDDGTMNGATWVSGDYIGDNALEFDGTDDYVDTGSSNPSGAMTYLATVDFSSGKAGLERIHDVGFGSTPGRRALSFRGDLSPHRVRYVAVNDGGSVFDVDYDLPSSGRYRLAAILDPIESEIRLSVNGSVETTTSASGSFQTQESNHKLARAAGSSQQFYEDILDEPMIANAAYTSQELTDDYDRQPWSS